MLSYDISSPHLDLDTGHFGLKSKELCHHDISSPHLDLEQVILDSSQKNYVII